MAKRRRRPPLLPCLQCCGDGKLTEAVCGYGHYDAPNERTYTCDRCDGGEAEPCESCGEDSELVLRDPSDHQDARWYCAHCADEALVDGWEHYADARPTAATTAPAHLVDLSAWEVAS